MPSSGEPVGKRKRSNTTLPTAKRHRPNPERNHQSRFRTPVRWFLRSRKHENDYINGPSTSSGKDLTPKRGVKRKLSEEVHDTEPRSKQPRKDEKVNELNKKRTSVSELQEQRISLGTNEREESVEIVGINDDEQCTKVTTGKESEKTTQVIRKSPSLEENPEIEENPHAEGEKIPPPTISIDELSKSPNQQKENKSDTDEIENKRASIDDQINDQSEEGVCEVKEVMEKATSINEEEELKINIKEDETEGEKDEVESGNSYKPQYTSSEESFAGDISVVDSSSSGLNIPGEAELLVKNEEEPTENHKQKSPYPGNLDEAK